MGKTNKLPREMAERECPISAGVSIVAKNASGTVEKRGYEGWFIQERMIWGLFR
jgi:hypothetical protein